MRLQIRSCQVDDASRLFAIQRDSFARLEGFQMRKWRENEFSEVLQQFFGYAIVDETGVVQAYILLQELHEAWEVLHLATHPDWWGRGLMTQLINFCLKERPERKALWLEVHEKNQRAIDLYEHLGFRRGGRRPRFYGDGGAAILYSHP